MAISAWYGKPLVYEHGLRARGLDSPATASVIKSPGDLTVAGVLAAQDQAAEVVAPAGGLMVR